MALNYNLPVAHATMSELMLPLALLTSVAAAYRLGMLGGIAVAYAAGLTGSLIVHAFDSNFGAMLAIAGGSLGRLRELGELRDRRFRALAENGTDLVLILKADGLASYASPSFGAILGYTPAALLGGGYRTLLGGTDGAVLSDALEQVRTSNSNYRFEFQTTAADGSSHVLDVALTNCLDEPAVRGIILNARDVSESRNAQAKLVEHSMYDTLTGLANRSLLNRHLDDELRSTVPGSLALLLIDLDRFKDVNDVLGHQAGDSVLCGVAQRLRGGFADYGFLARLGSDEFALVLHREHAAEATTIAHHIVEVLDQPFSLPAQNLSLGGTVGVAFSVADSTSSTLLRQADVAMYTAKRRRNSVAVYAADEDGRAISRLTMASALPSAIAANQFVLYYQPQLEIATGEVIGAEALVRWQHPERGLLLPDLFLPIAEEIGMIERLTDWVLRTAVEQIKQWNAAGLTLRISANLSAQDLRDGRLARTIPRLLSLHNIAPTQLCLELTETTVVTETKLAAECLHLLAASGVRIAIDDFGTGYSSLSHLKQFPVDEVKIDRQFVSDMERDAHDAAIVRSTIELAHRLNVDVVVEGVEDETTLGMLASLGADFAQGYGISRPMTAEAFEVWVREHRRVAQVVSAIHINA